MGAWVRINAVWYELVDVTLHVLIEDLAQRGGDVGFRVDAIQFAGADERGDARPGLGAVIRAGEQRVFSRKWNWPDYRFDSIGVHLDAPIVEEDGTFLPTLRAVSDVTSQIARGRDLLQACLQPWAQGVDERSGQLLISDNHPVRRIAS